MPPHLVEAGLYILIGVIVGYFLKTFVDILVSRGADTFHRDFIREFIAMVTVIVFLASCFKSFFDNAYIVPWEIPVLFGAVMSFVFGKENPLLSFITNRLNIKKNEESTTDK